MTNGILDSGQKIVTNGLILHHDISQLRSYPTTGTTVTDLSGNGYNSTLVNGVAFNSDNGGNLLFDGVNDYIQGTNSNNFNFCNATNDLPFSVSTWCYINNLTNRFDLFNKGDIGNGSLESYASRVDTTGEYRVVLYDTNGLNQTIAITTANVPTGTWVNLSHTYSGTGGYSGLTLYINGVAQTTTNLLNGTYTRMRVQSSNLFLGSFGSTGLYNSITSNGKYGIFQFYNSKLNSTQVLQNFNANRSRYGL